MNGSHVVLIRDDPGKACWKAFDEPQAGYRVTSAGAHDSLSSDRCNKALFRRGPLDASGIAASGSAALEATHAASQPRQRRHTPV